jgi:hypothetical protein
MDTNKLVGKILVTARHIPSTQVINTTILFEDRGDSIYYCWTFKDLSGTLIVNKCLPISKRIIDIDEFDYAINHAKFSIDNYRISRQKIFEVLEIQKR